MSIKTIALLLSLGGAAGAATTIISVEPTAMQVVVRVTTDQAGPCTYRAAEDAGFAALVHDIDPVLFAGANLDTRAGSFVQGSYHTMVLGRREADAAADGRRYSRALRANTPHWVGVTCGSDTEVTHPFQTADPPLGQSYPEAAPFDASAFGNYGWPSIDFTDQSKLYVDPMTGVALKRVTSPGWNAKDYRNNSFTNVQDLNSAWTNPANVVKWPGSASQLATYSGVGGDPLFAAVDMTNINDYRYGVLAVSGWGLQNTVDDVLVRTYGYGSDSSPANRTVLVCLTVDSGSTCNTPEISVVLPAGSAGTGPTAPAAGFPRAAWSGWATTPPFAGRDFGNVMTTVTTSGHTIANLGSQWPQYFSRGWKPGGKILVNDTEIYTIAQVINSTTITTVEALTVHASGVNFKSLCAGIRIRKQTGTGSISIATGYDMAVSGEAFMPFTGARNLCSSQTVNVMVDASGNPAPARSARLCAMPMAGSGHVLFAFFADNGETRFLSNLTSTVGYQYHPPDWQQYDGNNPSAAFWTESDIWSPTIATRAYTEVFLGGHPCLVQVDYTGDFSAWKPYPESNGYYVAGYWPDDHMKYTVLGGYPSDGRGVDQQTAVFGNPYFNPATWNTWSFTGLIAGGYATWQAQANQDYHGNENPTFFVLQDVTTGNVTKVVDTISTYPLRFWCNHGSQISGGFLSFTANICGNPSASSAPDPQRYLGGPFTLIPTQIQKSGAWSADTSLTASYAENCPTTIDPQWQALGATGQNCVLMQAKQPCSSNAARGEAAAFPCPWDGTPSHSMLTPVAPGDRFWLEFPPAPGSAETMRIVTPPVDQGNGIVPVLGPAAQRKLRQHRGKLRG